jgi:hypothetical protein
MVNLGEFGNEYAAKLHVLLPLVVAILIGLPVFGYAYNKLMDFLHGKEHTSVYVAGGVLVTLGVGALISWKAALMYLVLFALDGIFMIVGEFRRTEKQAKTRVKRLPYKANGLIAEAKMAATVMHSLMGRELESHDERLLIRIQHELTTVLMRLEELKGIQNEK